MEFRLPLRTAQQANICAGHLGIHGTSACGSGDTAFRRGAQRMMDRKTGAGARIQEVMPHEQRLPLLHTTKL